MRGLKYMVAVLSLGLLLSSCQSEARSGIGNLKITFLATWEGGSLVKNNRCSYEGEQEILINVSEFFFSDIALERNGLKYCLQILPG